jgi:four helix bundle protein
MFMAYEVSLQLVGSLRTLVPMIERGDRDLADQMRRAASSIVLNLAEGQRSAKGNRQKHYAIAHGSANEVKAALELARAWGWLDDSHDEGDTNETLPVRRAREAHELLDRLLAILWRLTHPR